MKPTLFILLSALLLVMPVLAANDPGHDTLYIEQIGNSTLTGTLNITGGLKVDGNQSISGLYLYGDGSTPSTLNYISGETGTDALHLGSPGDIYLKEYGGANVYVGSTGTPTYLQVRGIINGSSYINATNDICITGGNCLSLAGSGSGDVVGPSSAADNTVVRFDSTTGKLVQNSSVTIDDSNNIFTTGYINSSSMINSSVDFCITGGTCLSEAGGGSGDMSVWRLGADTGTDANITNNTLVNILGSGTVSTSISGNTITIDGSAHTTAYVFGDCPSGQFVQNTTAGGVECVAPAGGGDITGVIPDGVYVYNGSSTGEVNLEFNETKLNATIDARSAGGAHTNLSEADVEGYIFDSDNTGNLFTTGYLNTSNMINASIDVCITGGVCLSTVSSSAGGWTDSGTEVALTTATDNVSIGPLFIDNTIDEAQITGSLKTTTFINQTQTDGNIRYFGNGCYEKVNSTGLYVIC